jgi:hypothetical protein
VVARLRRPPFTAVDPPRCDPNPGVADHLGGWRRMGLSDPVLAAYETMDVFGYATCCLVSLFELPGTNAVLEQHAVGVADCGDQLSVKLVVLFQRLVRQCHRNCHEPPPMSRFMSRGVADSKWKPLEINGCRLQHERDMEKAPEGALIHQAIDFST